MIPNFKIWLESDEPERVALIQAIQNTWNQYSKAPIAPAVLQRMQQASIEELKQHLQYVEMEIKNKKLRDQWEKEKRDSQLQTNYDTYDRAYPGDGEERVVCGNENPGLDKTGMPMYPVGNVFNDPELKDYYCVHTGDADSWIDWLVDDGYCDGDIYIYHIEVPPNPPFYVAEDPNTGGWAGDDASQEVPSGRLLFSKARHIPAQYIKLSQVIKEKNYWRERKSREDHWD